MHRLNMLVLLLVSPLAWATNSPIELKTALADILLQLPGQYDNAAQVYFETATPETSGPPHDRVHMSFARIVAPAVGENVLLSTMRHGDKNGPIVDGESAVWTLSIDPGSKAVRMSPFQLRKPLPAGSAEPIGESLGSLTSTDLVPAKGLCAVLWRRYGNDLRGTVDASSCVQKVKREYVLTSQELWINDLPGDPRRVRDGNPDNESHVRLGKAREFECLLGFRPPSGAPQVSNGRHMDDRGDLLIWETEEPHRHTFLVELLRGMWPSESGRNYTDLLRISMFEIDAAKPADRKLLGTGWASAASDRASFGDGTYSARCKLFDPDMPPPK